MIKSVKVQKLNRMQNSTILSIVDTLDSINNILKQNLKSEVYLFLWKNIHQAKSNHKKVEVATLILDKGSCKKNTSRDKQEHFIMIQRVIKKIKQL